MALFKGARGVGGFDMWGCVWVWFVSTLSFPVRSIKGVSFDEKEEES